ncbi:hypothetical protein ACA910_016794 [Epithemia clementina (nom. ined.)]
MVIPPALPGGDAAAGRIRSMETEKAIQPPAAAVTKTSNGDNYAQTYDGPDFSRLGNESKDPAKSETWYNYFFGPSGDDTRQQLQQAHERHNLQQEKRDDAAASIKEERSHTALTTRQHNDEEKGTLPKWLAWLDPTVAPGCSEVGGKPSISSFLSPEDSGVIVTGEETGALSGWGLNSSTRKKSMGVAVNGEDDESGSNRRRLIDPPAVGGNDEDASVESSVEESKLFRDLESVPSTRVDTISDSIKTSDFDIHDASSTAASVSNSVVDNKIENIKMPRTTGKNPSVATQDKDTADQKSLEARRQILVKELRSTISTFGRYDVKTANISAALGDLLAESKQHDQSIKLHRDAVEIYSSKLGDDHSTTLEAKLQLGRVLENAGEYDEAINIYFLVTVMRRAINGEKDPSAADSLVLMANALRNKDDYHQAIKELKRALKIYREALGDAHSKVSSTVDEIASLYVTVGDFEKSAAILEEVVKLKAVTQGTQSKAVATTLCSLATTYECSEDFAKAMKSLKKAYKIYTEMDGYSSKEATNTLNRIAQLYEATGDYDRASIAYLGVLRGRKINHGDDHLLVGETYYKLGHSLRESGQHDKALKCLKEGLPIFVNKGVEINDVEMIAEVMHEMALINKDRKKFNEAARIFKQELGVRRKIGQADYPMIARTLNHLGVTEYEMKNNNKSLKYLIEALTIFKDRAEGSVECAEVLFNTGLVFESSRNRERAMEAYDEAARIFKEHGYKEDHPHLAKALRKIEKLQSQLRSGPAQKI